MEEDITFWDWLTKKSNRDLNKNISILSILAAIATFIFGATSKEHIDLFMLTPTSIFLLLNVIVLMLAVSSKPTIYFKQTNGVLSQIPESGNVDNKDPNLAVWLQKHFKSSIRGFWIASLILYGIIISETVYYEYYYKYDVGAVMNRIDDQKKVLKQGASELKNFAYNTKLGYYNPDLSNDFDKGISLIGDGLIRMNDSIFYLGRSHGQSLSYFKQIESGEEIILKGLITLSNDSSFQKLNNNHQNTVKNSLFLCMGQIERDVRTLKEHYRNNLDISLQILEILISSVGSIFLLTGFLILYKVPVSKSNEYMLSIGFIFSKNHADNEKDKMVASTTLKIWMILVASLSFFHIAMVTSQPESNDWIYLSIKLMSGLLNAMAMALLIARFVSKDFRSSQLGILMLLYSYAVIQSMFGLLGNTFGKIHYITELFTYLVALIGKTALYLYILYLFATQKLAIYLEKKLEENAKQSE